MTPGSPVRHSPESWRRAALGIAEDTAELHGQARQTFDRMGTSRLADVPDVTRSGQAVAQVARARLDLLQRLEEQVRHELDDAQRRMADASRDRDLAESEALDIVGRLGTHLREALPGNDRPAASRPEGGDR